MSCYCWGTKNFPAKLIQQGDISNCNETTECNKVSVNNACEGRFKRAARSNVVRKDTPKYFSHSKQIFRDER